jgi:mono/diheme cytochrome c family protein
MAKPGRKSKRGRSRRARAGSSRGPASRRASPRWRTHLLLAAAAAALVGVTLWRLLGEPGAEPTAGPTGVLQAGAAIYAEHCASCHGSDLEGQLSWRSPLPDGAYPAPPHDASGHTWHHPDSQLFEITKFGGQATAPVGFESRMPAFEEVLSDAEIWAVLRFIKSRWPRKEREHQEERARRSRSR